VTRLTLQQVVQSNEQAHSASWTETKIVPRVVRKPNYLQRDIVAASTHNRLPGSRVAYTAALISRRQIIRPRHGAHNITLAGGDLRRWHGQMIHASSMTADSSADTRGHRDCLDSLVLSCSIRTWSTYYMNHSRRPT